MTDPAGPDAGDGRDQLRDEAALWFARMRGAAAEAHKSEFEQWLARGALHRAAYNRIAEIFSAGKALKDEPDYADAGPVSGRRDHPASRRLALSMSVLAVLIAGTWLTLGLLGDHRDSIGKPSEIRSPDRRAAQLTTLVGEMRRVGLAEESYVTLDTDTLVVADLSSKRRLLRLERGRARFEVAHDPRPFIVLAGQGSVTAHGTVFDVALIPDREVSVRLLRGSVQVDVPDRDGGARRVVHSARLRPGEAVMFGVSDPAPKLVAEKPVDWTRGLLEFDHAKLSEVVAEANRYAVVKIVLAEPELASLRVSGRFRVDDGSALAERLAALFDLSVDRERPGVVLLHRRAPAK